MKIRYRNGIEIIGTRMEGAEFVIIPQFLDFIVIALDDDGVEDVYRLGRGQYREFVTSEYESEAMECLRRMFPK